VDWNSILLAGVSGGLAALITSLLIKNKEAKKSLYTVTLLVLFLAFNTLAKIYILPQLNAANVRAEVEQAFQDVPAFKSIQKYEPVIYQEMVNSLVEGKKQGLDEQQMIDVVRTKVATLVEKRIPHASDESLIGYVAIMVEEMRELQAKRDGSCFKFLFPAVAGGINPSKIISKQLLAKDLAALDEVIKTSNTPRAIPQQVDIIPLIEPTFKVLYETYGDDISLLENPGAAGIDQEKICIISTDLYSQILQLSKADASRTLRWMFSEM